MNAQDKPLGQLMTIFKGRKARIVHPKPSDNTRRYIQIADLHGTGTPTYTSDPEGVLAKPTDIIIAWDGANAGTIGFGLEGTIGSTLAVLRLDTREVYTPYLGYLLKSKFRLLNKHTTGATIPHLSRHLLETLKIRLPPLPEQRRIAAIFDHADSMRQKQRTMAPLAEELLRSAFLEMLGDPVTNPKRWPVKKLGDILTFLTSGSRGWAKFYSERGPLFVRIQNVGRDKLLMDDVIRVMPPDNAEARRTKVKAGDVLLSITADLGRTAVVPRSLEGAHINQHLALLRVKGIEPEYLSTYLASHAGQSQITKLNRQGVKAGLNFEDIQSLRVVTPPIEQQQRFARLKQRHQSLLQKHHSVEDGLHRLHSSLNKRYMAHGSPIPHISDMI